MIEDANREYHDTMQEVMLELKLKTDRFLKKLKDCNKNAKFMH